MQSIYKLSILHKRLSRLYLTSSPSQIYSKQKLSLDPSLTPQQIRTASLQLLFHESFKRAAGKPLLEVSDLLQLPKALDEMRCCLLIVEPRNPPTLTQGESMTRDVIDNGDGALSDTDVLSVSYANIAAHQMICNSHSWNDDHNIALSNSLVGSKFSEILPHHGELSLKVIMQASAPPRMEVHRQIPLHQLGGCRAKTDVLIVCDVCSPSGRTLGRALLFDSWHFEDGRLGRPLVPALMPSEVPGPTQVQQSENAVLIQADIVRNLKLKKDKNDPEIQMAVKILQEAKVNAENTRNVWQTYSPDALSLIQDYVVQGSTL